MYKNFFKGIIDFIAALIGLILLSPLFILLTIILFFHFKGNPFFMHPRPGQNEKIFKLIKFKSMKDDKDENGVPLPYNERVTNVGRIIRKLSFDEIPQLINVIKGDMSLIGPRPLLVDYLPRYNEYQKQRHNVKPGISGWAQVNGRNSISWEQKFSLDVWYVDNLSFSLDIKILLLTIKKVILKENVNLSETVNMTPFQGSNQ